MKSRNKGGQLNVGAYVLIVMGIVVCIALLAPIFANQNIMTEKQSVTDEADNLVTAGCIVATADGGQVNTSDSNCNITLTYAPSGWKATNSECYLISVTVGNSTTDFTEGTDYNLYASTGIIQLLNTTDTQEGFANATVTDYSFCGEGYNPSGASRSIATLIGLFAVLALVGFVLEKTGITNFTGIGN